MLSEPAIYPPVPFGDYIVFVDESGDHSMERIDSNYPVFVLAFCIFHKRQYTDVVCPELQALKLKYWGHDTVVLHEKDIIKQSGPFGIFKNLARREVFIGELDALIDKAPFTLVAVAINKEQHRDQYSDPAHPYHLAMQMGLERVCSFLEKHGQEGKLTHIVFESRGKHEDQELELEFRRVTGSTGSPRCRTVPLDIVMCFKATNSCGLQVADLVARPIGRHLVNPGQLNRAFVTISKKFRRGANGQHIGYGLKIFP